jgi:hypothetical protein
MKHKKLKLSIVLLLGLGLTEVYAQEAVPATGGNASGSGGSVSYTIGQVVYTTNSGTNGSVAQGVQQPFEISVVTAFESAREISLQCKVYPNPTHGIIKLIIEFSVHENLRFRLYDINGVILQDKKVESSETEISMDNLSSSIYFLKVTDHNKEVKVFKIIKN